MEQWNKFSLLPSSEMLQDMLVMVYYSDIEWPANLQCNSNKLGHLPYASMQAEKCSLVPIQVSGWVYFSNLCNVTFKSENTLSEFAYFVCIHYT